MKISELISTFRTVIKERTDDSPYTDQELYLIMNSAANRIKTEVLDKKHKLGPKNYVRICVPLEKVDFADCDCIPSELQCKVLRSKFEMPSSLVSRSAWTYRITNIHGQQIGFLNHIKRKYMKDHPMVKKSWDIIDSYLYVFGDLLTKVVLVEFIPEDVTILSTIGQCSPGGPGNPTEGTPTGNPCFDIETEDFPLEDQYTLIIYEMAMKIMGLKLPEDIVEDGRKA